MTNTDIAKKQIGILAKIENFQQTVDHVRAVQDNMFKVCNDLILNPRAIELVDRMCSVLGLGNIGQSPQADTVNHLLRRLLVHDTSKFSDNEWPNFAEANGGGELASLEYGSSEYKQQLRSILGPALAHHYANNDHHPEHYENGIMDMSLPAVIEMLCDWEAATRRHNTGDIYKSIQINKDRFGYDDKTEEMFTKFVETILNNESQS